MDPPPASSSWTNILKTKPTTAPQPQPPSIQPNPNPNPIPGKPREGVSTAVVDANAVIEGGEKLNSLADRFVTVPEVLSEIRDPASRHRLSFLPFSIHPLEPSPDSLLKVIKFARATGDLQTLSDVDLKLIALTYTLEAQVHGTAHLRDAPPPVHTINVKRLPEKDLPGWGSNVPNLEEWEVLEREGDGDEVNGSSRILPLKDINLNVVVPEEGARGLEGGSVVAEVGVEDGRDGGRRNRRYPVKKREVKIDGKKMVVEGFNASNGEIDDDAGDWRPAVSRSTHRRYLRRKARREYNEALLEKASQQEAGEHGGVEREDENGELNLFIDQKSEVADALNEKLEEGENLDVELSWILEQMRVEESSLEAFHEEGGEKNASLELEVEDENNCIGVEECEVDDANNGELDSVDLSSQTNQSLDTSRVDEDAKTEDGSERSWTLRSLSESSVACVTGDFAMQNVLLQMGLRLLAPGGNQIRQLHRWILKCHACYTVTAEIGRIFCPKCGNGGTLRKVAVTVGENGIVLAARRPRISLRGTKFSLPLPQGGRDAISKNPVLREDQLPQKFLYPKTKKKVNKEGDDFFAIDYMFSHHMDKKAPFRPPVRKTLAVFSGKRNPNDNHFSRPKH